MHSGGSCTNFELNRRFRRLGMRRPHKHHYDIDVGGEPLNPTVSDYSMFPESSSIDLTKQGFDGIDNAGG